MSLFTLTIYSNAYGQSSYMMSDDISYNTTTEIDLHIDNIQLTTSTKSYGYGETTIGIGPGMMLGGAAFILAGALTVPDYECISNTGIDGGGSAGYHYNGCTLQPKPFFKQGARMLAIVSGGVLVSVGIVVSLGGF